jgi:hypothetical protein
VKIVTLTAVSGLFAALWGGVEVMDRRYVASKSFDSLSVEIFYDRYYDTEDRINDRKDDPDADLTDLKRRLERLRSKICKIEPEWEQCKGQS